MKEKKERRQKNIAQQVKSMMLIFIPLVICYGIICSVILSNIRKLTMQELSEMSQLYVNEIDNRFFRISRRILLMVMDTRKTGFGFMEYVEQIQQNENEIMENFAVNQLREEFLQYTWEYGEEYHFFLYLKEQDAYYSLDMEPEEDHRELYEALVEKIKNKGDFTYSIKQKWDGLFLHDENYVYKTVERNGVYLSCYVNVADLLQPFEAIDLGANGYVQLVNHDGKQIGYLGKTQSIEANANMMVKETKRAPFSIWIYVSSERIIGVLMGVLGALLILALLIFLVSSSLLLYLRSYILKPIQTFTDKLLQYDEEDSYIYHITENSLLELEQMDEQFEKMMRQIKKLKITLYEQEIEKQKMELDTLKLQIRPHFYLNCLNFIYSMIDFGQYENAKEMSKITASYLRYIFRDSKEMVFVATEMGHCEDYLEILLLRYEDAFEYYLEIEDEVKEAEIYPFLIQVFVENAVKHALTLDKKILISVTVFPEEQEDEEYVNIYISDTGAGFQTDVLEQLNQGKGIMTEEGEHVGIANCLKRFQYIYGERGSIYFKNSPLGGAIVDIHIPKENGIGKGEGQ